MMPFLLSRATNGHGMNSFFESITSLCVQCGSWLLFSRGVRPHSWVAGLIRSVVAGRPVVNLGSLRRTTGNERTRALEWVKMGEENRMASISSGISNAISLGIYGIPVARLSYED